MKEAPAALGGEFAALYSLIGRPSIPPEKLLRAMLLQAFYSIRSERLLMERSASLACRRPRQHCGHADQESGAIVTLELDTKVHECSGGPDLRPSPDGERDEWPTAFAIDG